MKTDDDEDNISTSSVTTQNLSEDSDERKDGKNELTDQHATVAKEVKAHLTIAEAASTTSRLMDFQNQNRLQKIKMKFPTPKFIPRWGGNNKAMVFPTKGDGVSDIEFLHEFLQKTELSRFEVHLSILGIQSIEKLKACEDDVLIRKAGMSRSTVKKIRRYLRDVATPANYRVVDEKGEIVEKVKKASVVLRQTNVEGHRVHEVLGLPEFLEALDTPSEMLNAMVKKAMNEFEAQGGVIEDEVREFAKIFLRHHRMYHSDVVLGLDLDVYWSLAVNEFHTKEVAGDREDDDYGKRGAEGESEAGTFTRRGYYSVRKEKFMAAGKVIVIALTQISLPMIIFHDTMFVENDGEICRHYKDRSADVDDSMVIDQGLQLILRKTVLFVFVGYLAVYAYYKYIEFRESMYFSYKEYAYFQTCHEFWIQMGILANSVSSQTIVLLTALVLFYTDALMDMILNAMALVFLSELDNELVSSAEEERYTLRMQRWMNVAYNSWTADANKFPKGFRKGFRRPKSRYTARLHYVLYETGFFDAFCKLVLLLNFLSPIWLAVCY